MSREASDTEAPAAEAPAAEAPRRRRRGRKTGEVTFCTVECKYECVREAAQAQGWRLVGDSERSTEEEIQTALAFYIEMTGHPHPPFPPLDYQGRGKGARARTPQVEAAWRAWM